MLRRIFVFFLLIIIVLVGLSGTRPHQVAAQENVFYNVEQTSTIPTMTSSGVTYPDWNNLSFSSIPPSTGAGYFDIYEMANQTGLEPDNLVLQFGYDPTRSWDVGTPIENILKLGDLRTNSNLENWTINNIASYTGMDLSLLRLGDFGLLGRESIEDVVDAVPSLGSYRLSEVKPLFDLVKTRVTPEKAVQLGRQNLATLSDRLHIGTIKLEELDLSQYDLTSIPNLEKAKFGSFINWEDSFLSEIPGLANVPIASFLLDLAQGGFLAKLDVVWGDSEANRTNTISGSYEAGFSVPCEQENCPHIELTDAVPSPTRPLHGKQWISGFAQKVKGGSGLLAAVGGGSEPTGRHPFGDAFKVVLTDTNESTGTASFSVYFRICGSIFFGGKTCTPYIIGPFPWFSHKEKDLVFVGVDGVESEVPASKPPVPSIGEIPDAIADKLPPGFEGDGDTGGFYDTDFSNNADDCETYKGVNIGALRQAIANQESRGSGDYKAVGIWVEVREGGRINSGRALGKYQFMSYREDVEAVFFRKKGGPELLKRIEQQTISVPEIKQVLLDYFPPETQEKLRVDWFKKLINDGYASGRRGDALIQIIGAWHNGGQGNPQYPYGANTVKEYKKELPKSRKKCRQKSAKGKCTGKFIRPATGTRTSGFGGRWHPISGQYRPHNGVDIAAPTGTPILAADGGEVTFTKTGCRVGQQSCGGGFGNYITLKHCDGWVTVYAHLSKVSIKRGKKVSQGQRIGDMGSTGSSTGPHLHFETHKNGQKLNPEKYLPKL